MKIVLSTDIDCDGMPMRVAVESEVPTGSDDIAVSLYDAMVVACRLAATAARDDQMRTHAEHAAQ